MTHSSTSIAVASPKPSRMLRAALCALLLAVAATHSTSLFAQAPLPYLDPSLTPQQRAADLVSRMTIDEKALQSINTAPAIPRLGVPAYDYWSEGLHGVARSGYATLFPQAIGMAATWDSPLFHDFGIAVSTEARAKYNDAVSRNLHSIYFGLTIWSPNINIFRDPRWGRGQETYGEDPFLTATLGDQFVRALQGDDAKYFRVIATPKHFAVHSGPESDRHRFDVTPSRHDLWETYLPAFRKTIVEAKADSIMCAYNAIDGKPACASDLLLNDILRNDWQFKGFVTSDCGAIDDFFEPKAHHFSPSREAAAAEGIKLGTDTNCGATYKALPAALQQGLVTQADVDRDLQRLFEARIRLGLFDPPAMVPYSKLTMAEDRSAAHLALSLKASEESIVLLKNDGILPLTAQRFHTIAVVGPNAASLAALEGNYNAIPKDPQMPVDALQQALLDAHITYAQGAPYADGLSLPVPRSMLHPFAGSPELGLHGEYFAGMSTSGKPAAVRTDHEIAFDWNDASPADGLAQNDFSVRWTGVIVPIQAGRQQFSMRLNHCYPCHDGERYSVILDGKSVAAFGAENKDSRGSSPIFEVDFKDTHPVPIQIEYSHSAPLFGAGLTFEWVPPAGVLQTQAAALAGKADLTIAMVGLSPDLEGEEMPIHVAGFAGGDRTDIQLPAPQQQLLEAVAATGKPLLVVLLNGSALAVNWPQQHANAVLEAWYPGEFGGKAIAETLLGSNNPAGRLPLTFYASLEDLPPFNDYSMTRRTYRYYTGKPLYHFGYGLSYTSFAYSPVKLSTSKLTAGDHLIATVSVRNTGKCAGDEVVQAYLIPPADGNHGLSPRLHLVAFLRVHVAAGEEKPVNFDLDPRWISEVDVEGNRIVQPGKYTLSIGGSQPDDPLAPTPVKRVNFTISGTAPLPR